MTPRPGVTLLRVGDVRLLGLLLVGGLALAWLANSIGADQVLHQEGSAWKLVHMHVSVGVPDEEVVELQKRWSSAS